MTRLQQKTATLAQSTSVKPPSVPITGFVPWPNGQAQKSESVSEDMIRLRARRFREGAANLGNGPRVADTTKTQGEIEAALCEAMSRFEQEYMGRGPREIHAYVLGDFVVVRLQGSLTAAEQQLAKDPSQKGRDMLKQVRKHLIETARPLLQAMVQEITGVKAVSLHYDISTVSGEAFVVLSLAEAPSYRQVKKT